MGNRISRSLSRRSKKIFSIRVIFCREKSANDIQHLAQFVQNMMKEIIGHLLLLLADPLWLNSGFHETKREKINQTKC